MKKQCEVCGEYPAEWILYVAGAELVNGYSETAPKKQVCGCCVPSGSERVSGFAWQEPQPKAVTT